MGKLLRLKNGQQYTAMVDSTITALNIPVQNYADVDAMRAQMTVANLQTVEFDGRSYTDMSLISESATRDGGNIVAHLNMELGIEDRIAMERQAAIDDYTLQLIEEGLL